MTTPPAPSHRLILQTAQALSIDAGEPWASLSPERRLYWSARARAEHGAPAFEVDARVRVTRGVWSGVAGRVLEVVPDATGDNFYRVDIGEGRNVVFLHGSEIAPEQ